MTVTKFDDLGVIIMRKRCSIQQGENIAVDQSKVLKNRLYRLFCFFWATRYIYGDLAAAYYDDDGGGGNDDDVEGDDGGDDGNY